MINYLYADITLTFFDHSIQRRTQHEVQIYLRTCNTNNNDPFKELIYK